ncbi:MFS transporter [Thermomonospora umbrina]|uniref:DHA2 family multidrug resistance protein-like MFS transporter n=1 Tax=Thermomonospora umbrina TaxID=111806 RepID=A0A3D9STD0_9ACTN|nr:MFS transporter [Thermomonospora umbrina]REE94961.1 DHA2 family multidrug resistance protein-like MFS transporter [Thermomonospora umbrina]
MSSTTTTKAGRREWIGLAVLALPTLLLSLDVSVLYLALPELSAELRPTSAQQLWIMDVYGFMIAGFLVTMGTLGDRIGRRRLLMIGGSFFAAASVLAAYSTSAEMLIATRAVLGIAGATLMPSTLALLATMFADARQRSVAIAVWMSCFMAGAAVGPVVGGVLLEWFWWGSAFLLGVPVMALLLVAAPVLLPEHRDTGAGRLDPASVVLSLAALLPTIYGLKEAAEHGLGAAALAALVAGIAFGALFVRRQRSLADPLMDVSLFRNRAFTASLGILLFGMAVTGGGYLFVSQYLQLVEGMSAISSGLWLVPSAVGIIVTSMAAPVLARRARPATVVAVGLAMSAAGYAVLAQTGSDGVTWPTMVGFVLGMAGTGPLGALGIGLVVGSVPAERAGSASALSETSGELGIALGVAVFGSIGTAAYRGDVTVPPGVPADVAQEARDGLAGAVGAAERATGAQAAAILDGARDAFTGGLNTVAGVGAVTFAALAVLAMVLLRQVGTIGEEAHETTTAEEERTRTLS